jgi:Na+/phosphate symporter
VSSTVPNADQVGPLAISKDDVTDFIKKLLDEVKDSQVDEEKAAEHLPQFLAKLFKKLAKEFAFDEPKLKLVDHIHQKVAQGLRQIAEWEPTLAAA